MLRALVARLRVASRTQATRIAMLSLVILGPSPALGADIPIVNPSFEDDLPAVSGGGWTRDPLSGWVKTGDGGPYNAPAAGFPAGGKHGQVVAWMHLGTLSQVLGARLASATHYTLEVGVGNVNDMPFPGYEIQLRAGEQVLASRSSPAPADGAFATITLIHETAAAHPLEGQALEIRLVSDGPEVSFDNVRLAAVPTSTAVNAPFTARLDCPPTARRAGIAEISATFTNPRSTAVTLSRAAVVVHAGELRITGPSMVPVTLMIPAAVDPSAPGSESITIPVVIPGDARAGAVVSIGLGFFGRAGGSPSRRLLAVERCTVDIVR